MAETEKNMDTTNVTGEATGNEAAEEKGRVYTQADIDALIEKRLAREKRDQEKRLQEARTAGEKAGEARARMSEEERLRSDRERAEQEAGEREAQLRQREQELVSRELRIDALDALAKKGLPRELADLLVYTDREQCIDSLNSVEKVFRAAVQAGIEERIRKSAGTVSAGGGQKPDTSKMSDAEYYASLNKK